MAPMTGASSAPPWLPSDRPRIPRSRRARKRRRLRRPGRPPKVTALPAEAAPQPHPNADPLTRRRDGDVGANAVSVGKIPSRGNTCRRRCTKRAAARISCWLRRYVVRRVADDVDSPDAVDERARAVEDPTAADGGAVPSDHRGTYESECSGRNRDPAAVRRRRVSRHGGVGKGGGAGEEVDAGSGSTGVSADHRVSEVGDAAPDDETPPPFGAWFPITAERAAVSTAP